MTNKELAEQVLRGRKKFVRVADRKGATAVRVAGHRLGGVLTAQRVEGGWSLVKSMAKVGHRGKEKAKPSRRKRD